MCNKFSYFEDRIASELVTIDQHIQQNFTKLLNCCKCPPIHTRGGTGGWRQVGFDSTTHLTVLSSTDWVSDRITGTGVYIGSLTSSATCSLGVVSHIPALRTLGTGVCHVQVDYQ